MTEVTLLIDNDIVIKLAQMAVYEDALSAIDTLPTKVGSLGHMLRYMGKASIERRRSFMKDDAGTARLATILLGLTEIEPTVQEMETAAAIMRSALENELDLHEGEVGLFAVAIHRQAPDVATGDKKAIRALPVASNSESSLNVLKGRLICFEQIVNRVCDRHGLDRVRKAVQTAPCADATISQAFQEYGGKGANVFNQLLAFLIQKQIAEDARGWLKTYA